MAERKYALRTSLCDFYFSRNGEDYDLTAAVDSAAFEDPERKHLTRGSSGQNSTGLIYTEGIKDPKTLTVVFIGLSAEYAALLADMYKEEERTDFKIIDRKTGQMRSFKDAIVSQKPAQATMSEGAEEQNVQVVFECFTVEDK